MSVEDFLLGSLSGAGALFVLWKAFPRILRVFNYEMPRTGLEKQIAVQKKAIYAVEAAFEFARAQADLAEEVGREELPRDFDPAIHCSFQVSAACERELKLQAEREGLIPAGLADRLMGRSPEPPAAYSPEEELEPVTAEPVRRVRGKLLPMRRKAAS